MQKELTIFNMAAPKVFAIHEQWQRDPRGKSLLATYADEHRREELEAEAKARGVRPAASAQARVDHIEAMRKLGPVERTTYFRQNKTAIMRQSRH